MDTQARNSLTVVGSIMLGIFLGVLAMHLIGQQRLRALEAEVTLVTVGVEHAEARMAEVEKATSQAQAQRAQLAQAIAQVQAVQKSRSTPPPPKKGLFGR